MSIILNLRNLIETAIIIVIDILSLLVVFQVSVLIRKDILPLIYPAFPKELPFGSFIEIWWVFAVWIFFLYYEGLYTKSFSFWDEVKALWKATFFATVGTFTIISIGKLSEEVSRTVFILMGMLSILLLPFIRIGSKKTLKRFGLFKRRVLILGAGETGKLIARALKKEPNYGYEVIGFLDDDPEKVGKHIDRIKIHRGVDKAYNYITKCNIKDIVIAMPGAKKEMLHGLINELQHKVDRILYVPDMFNVAVLGTSIQHFFHEQAFALEMKNNLSRPLNIFIKRCFDLLTSIILIILLIVPMVIIAFLIRLDSKGPAIFLQERVGKRGKRFKCLKFRTMYLDADERLRRLLEKDLLAKEEWEKYWKLKNDPRVTKIGRFLRRTSLDELPQLINVLKGEMSLVGPRPYLPDEVEVVGDRMEPCFYVPPGITGLWQVSGRSDRSYEERITLDLWYVRNWNLWLDIVILLKTIRVVLQKEGAR